MKCQCKCGCKKDAEVQLRFLKESNKPLNYCQNCFIGKMLTMLKMDGFLFIKIEKLDFQEKTPQYLA